MLTQFPVDALKNIKSSYWGKMVPILDLLHSIREYVLYCENKKEKYKAIFYKKSKITKISSENLEIIKIMNQKEVTDIGTDDSHDKILGMT